MTPLPPDAPCAVTERQVMPAGTTNGPEAVKFWFGGSAAAGTAPASATAAAHTNRETPKRRTSRLYEIASTWIRTLRGARPLAEPVFGPVLGSRRAPAA